MVAGLSQGCLQGPVGVGDFHTRPEEMGQESVHRNDQEFRLQRDERGCGQRGGPYQAGLGGHGRECALGSKCCGSCWRAFM